MVEGQFDGLPLAGLAVEAALGLDVFHAVSLQGRCRLSGRRVTPLQLAHGQPPGASNPPLDSNAVPR